MAYFICIASTAFVRQNHQYLISIIKTLNTTKFGDSSEPQFRNRSGYPNRVPLLWFSKKKKATDLRIKG